MFEVKQADGVIVQEGEFNGSSVLGVTQLHWRLRGQKQESFTYANEFVFINLFPQRDDGPRNCVIHTIIKKNDNYYITVTIITMAQSKIMMMAYIKTFLFAS